MKPPSPREKPQDLEYASRTTPAQRPPGSKFNKLDLVQIAIVVVVAVFLALAIIAWTRRLRAW